MKNNTVVKKHFILLVRMGGQYTDLIGQHSTEAVDEAEAKRWGVRRFDKPFAIVDMSDTEALSLSSEEAQIKYLTTQLY